MNKIICIAPFTKKEYPILENLSKNYSALTLLSPRGIGVEGEDISILKNTYKTGYEFSNSILKSIKNSDVILITEVKKENRTLYAYAIRVLETSITEGKEIICFLELNDTEYDIYRQQCENKGVKHYFFRSSTAEYRESDMEEEFKTFSIPVIYISEMIPDCDGYDIYLKLINQLEKDGKNVLAISQDAYNVLFDQVHMTFWKEADSRKMVYWLNHIIHNLVYKRRPDILLIRLPEPMMKYDNVNTYDFGLTAFLLSQAIPGDGCICCSYAGTPPIDFWGNINESFTAKFGYPIIGVHVCNQVIDGTEEKWISTMRISDYEIGNEIKILNQYNDLVFYQLLMEEEFHTFNETLNIELFDIPYGVI